MAAMVTIDKRLYLTAAGDRVVPADDPAAARLWAAPGQRKPRAEAERLGAVPRPRPPAAAAPAKQRRTSANKQRRGGSSKAAETDPADPADGGPGEAGERPGRSW